MGGIDIANSLQAVYESRHKAQCSWWLLFYWWLDTVLVKAYHINYIPRAKHKLPRLTHAEFCEALYKYLSMQGYYKHKREYEYEQKCELILGLEDEHGVIWGEKAAISSLVQISNQNM